MAPPRIQLAPEAFFAPTFKQHDAQPVQHSTSPVEIRPSRSMPHQKLISQLFQWVAFVYTKLTD
jgi:hypothetical protein